MIGAGIAEGRQHRGRVHRHNRAALHARPAAPAELTEDDDRTREHIDTGKVTAVTTYGNQTIAHPMPHLIACLTVDQDLAAAHTYRCAAIGATHQMAGITLDDDPPACHLRTHPVAGIALDHDFTARHARPKMQAHIPLDRDATARHAGTDIFDPREIPLDLDRALSLAT